MERRRWAGAVVFMTPTSHSSSHALTKGQKSTETAFCALDVWLQCCCTSTAVSIKGIKLRENIFRLFIFLVFFLNHA